MRFQLVAKISDAELLRKSMHELGTVFYQTDEDGNITKVVYFSDSRVVEFNGRLDDGLVKKFVKSFGRQVDSIETTSFKALSKLCRVEVEATLCV